MGVHNTRITSDEYAMADTLVIDEGGIDLLQDGDSVLAASFEGLDPFQLMFDILPEDFRLPSHLTKEGWEAALEETRKDAYEASRKEIDEGIEEMQNAIYAALWTLAIVKGWSK